MLQVNSLKFSHNIFIRQLTHWALNEKMIIHSFKFKVQVNLNYRREWNRANRCLLDFSSQLGMAMNFTESYLQKLWLVHYEYREFDWGAVCKMVPESWMFLRYYKGSCPSIEIVNVPNCCGDGIDWLSFRHVHKDEFWFKLKGSFKFSVEH